MKNKVIKVLDDGFVRLVDFMGTDADICKAARVSYAVPTDAENTESTSKALDKKLINYLMKHSHTSPFEMCELKFHIRIPMDAWRQMIRHRTANVNEYSTRYSVAIDSQQTTEMHEWRQQAKDNKQGSSGFFPAVEGAELTEEERLLHEHAREVYKNRIDSGVAKEQARKDLPLSTYTEAYWKMDLHNLLHFLKLRLDPHAQKEIREYASVISDFVKYLFPLTWEAFENYKLNAITLSVNEQKWLKDFINSNTAGTFPEGNTRDAREFREKINKILNS